MSQNDEMKIFAVENSTEKLTAYNRIPYALINKEISGTAKDTLAELTKICSYYKAYRKGVDFTVEGTNGDYVPATLRFKMSASLINKEARFLFAEPPSIVIESKGNVGTVTEDARNTLTTLNDLVKTILDKNNFEDALLKAAKDCFVGKRVSALVNFNEDDGVTITFLPATQFIYDTKTGNPNILTKYVCFIIVKDSTVLSDKKIFEKKFVLEDDGFVYLSEIMYDGTGKILEEVTEYQQTMLNTIPAVIFINEGLTGEMDGESEIESLCGCEEWFSKLSNADIDAGRKSMNPIRYTTDMESSSTRGLSSSAGAYWDLLTDQNLEHPSPKVGLLESSMGYSDSLKTTLDRLKTTGYDFVDMPNVTLEALQGAITSGKSLKAIYWPLVVRCKEKMKMWGPQLRAMIDIIIKGSLIYPNCVKMYTNDEIFPVDYKIKVEQNLPLPEDEAEEKQIDMSEVQTQVRSKKSYMKKWYKFTDAEADEEIKQMAFERQMLEDSAFDTNNADGIEDEL